jgi:hypothetical protein
VTANELVRTPREWDETCRECKGTGFVHKREHFALWTPDEYARVMPMEHVPAKLEPGTHRGVESVPNNAMICVVHGGASILDACKEAVTLSRAAGRPVAFEFNGAVAVCVSDSDDEHVITTLPYSVRSRP